MLSYSVFFYWTQVLWTDMSDECMSGYCLMDFFIWLSILLMTVGPAIFVAIGSCIFVCCAPCIIKMIKDYREQVNND